MLSGRPSSGRTEFAHLRRPFSTETGGHMPGPDDPSAYGIHTECGAASSLAEVGMFAQIRIPIAPPPDIGVILHKQVVIPP